MTTPKVSYYYPYPTIRKLASSGDQPCQFAWAWGVSKDMEFDIVKPGRSRTKQDKLVRLGLEKLNNLPKVTPLESG